MVDQVLPKNIINQINKDNGHLGIVRDNYQYNRVTFNSTSKVIEWTVNETGKDRLFNSFLDIQSLKMKTFQFAYFFTELTTIIDL